MVYLFGSLLLCGSVVKLFLEPKFWNLFIIASIFLIVFEFLRIYKMLWRYAENKELLRMIIACLLASVFASLIVLAIEQDHQQLFLVIFVTLTTSFTIILTRIIYRSLMSYHRAIGKRSVVIVGGGESGAMLLKSMGEKERASYRVVGIFDDNKNKWGKEISAVSIVGGIDLVPEYCLRHKIDDIIIAIPSATTEQINRIVNICNLTKCNVRIMPSFNDILEKNAWQGVKKIEMEDLLGRASINLTSPLLKQQLENKVVLVTGGGGSIGSELCRQIAHNNPSHLIILDYYENNAYEIQQELSRAFKDTLNLTVEICNIRERDKVDYVLNKYRPDLIFHAAAHKHVPLMEHNPEEAVKNNVLGTYNLAVAACKYNVDKFILISTDKAVNPTNVMGATKRICEMIIQAMSYCESTKYAAVRFGNVLGSNGSVFHQFRKQIEQGGPVTVTHPEMVRFFMTIKEAVSLVLTASANATTGTVFVLDMGKPIKISEFAKTLIRLTAPNKNIHLEYIGLRPGEKLYEELLVDNSKKKTEYDKIFIEEMQAVDISLIEQAITSFKDCLEKEDKDKLMELISYYVPSYCPPKSIGLDSLPKDIKYN